jgi:hypothetical protein
MCGKTEDGNSKGNKTEQNLKKKSYRKIKNKLGSVGKS